ncbi:hypothetical protein AADZ91_15370 [Colwelliaceae bacterium 6441]
MKNKQYLSIWLVSLFLIAGCSQLSDSVRVTTAFWQAFNENDKQGLEAVLKAPKDAEFLVKGKSTHFDYEVLGEVAEGVEVKFSRFCYPDVIASTILVDVAGEKKVDFMATFRAQMAAMKGVSTTKKYCYDFNDVTLTGKLNGQAWSFVKTNIREINWGNKITQSVKVYAENCDVEAGGACTLPALNISNLKLDGEGGNFSNIENLSIYVYPSFNNIVSSGSYRITKLDDGRKKIELSFEKDRDNYLSGHFILTDM